MSEDKSFVDRCLTGTGFLDDIDDAIEDWHTSDDHRPVWRFLGMKRSEYALWLERPESLRFIIAAHRRDVGVSEVLESQERHLVAARADYPDDAEKVIRWLERTDRLG